MFFYTIKNLIRQWAIYMQKKCFCYVTWCTFLCGHVDIEVQTVFALVMHVCCHRVQVGGKPHRQHVSEQQSVLQVLRTHRSELCGVPDAWPRRWRLGGLKPAFSSRGHRIRYAQILLHGAQDLTGQRHPQSTQLPIVRGDGGVLCLLTNDEWNSPNQSENLKDHSCSEQTCKHAERSRYPDVILTTANLLIQSKSKCVTNPQTSSFHSSWCWRISSFGAPALMLMVSSMFADLIPVRLIRLWEREIMIYTRSPWAETYLVWMSNWGNKNP